jgi:hypothetical protein
VKREGYQRKQITFYLTILKDLNAATFTFTLSTGFHAIGCHPCSKHTDRRRKNIIVEDKCLNLPLIVAVLGPGAAKLLPVRVILAYIAITRTLAKI